MPRVPCPNCREANGDPYGPCSCSRCKNYVCTNPSCSEGWLSRALCSQCLLLRDEDELILLNGEWWCRECHDQRVDMPDLARKVLLPLGFTDD